MPIVVRIETLWRRLRRLSRVGSARDECSHSLLSWVRNIFDPGSHDARSPVIPSSITARPAFSSVHKTAGCNCR